MLQCSYLARLFLEVQKDTEMFVPPREGRVTTTFQRNVTLFSVSRRLIKHLFKRHLLRVCVVYRERERRKKKDMSICITSRGILSPEGVTNIEPRLCTFILLWFDSRVK